jgi:succinate dehydrogenase / fumarate reductase, cytochrome b subunit
MDPRPAHFLRSSIFRKQLIAITGMVLIVFVVLHLLGNLLLYAGPATFNAYSERLLSLGALLWLARFGLIVTAVAHVGLTLQVVFENYKARGARYAEFRAVGKRSVATRTMKYTGLIILGFLFLHLYDFTFGDKTGSQSIITGLAEGESLHLYGLVWNAFKVPWRSVVYMVVMVAVGLHTAHGFESVFQTAGFNHDRYTPWLRLISVILGVVVAVGFISIPLYVLILSRPFGV